MQQVEITTQGPNWTVTQVSDLNKPREALKTRVLHFNEPASTGLPPNRWVRSSF